MTGVGAREVEITDLPGTEMSEERRETVDGPADPSTPPVQAGFIRSDVDAERPVDATLPVLTLLRESATACGLRIGRLTDLPLRLDWVDTWRAPAQTAQRTAAWWWPFGMGEVSAAVGLTGEAAAFLADIFLGGDGSAVTADTPSGELEIAILGRHLGACFQPLEFLETPAAPSDSPHQVGLANPASSSLPHALEVADVLMIRLALKDPNAHHGDVLLMLPARPLLGGEGPTRPPAPRASAHDVLWSSPSNSVPAPPTMAGSTSGVVHGVPVTVHFRLPAVSLSALDVAGLETGDVVRLHRAMTVEGFLGGAAAPGARVLFGALGQRDGQLAVQVHELTLESQ